MILEERHTRFRAYQLKTIGSSFSYWDGRQFTLGEARFNEDNSGSIRHELYICGKKEIDVLHITSWDTDHCNPSELKAILLTFNPHLIEQPGNQPHTDDGKESAKIIARYCNLEGKTLVVVDPQNVSWLPLPKLWDYTDVHLENPKHNPNPSDNSSIKLFRSGCFSVLSLGDVVNNEIREDLVLNPIIHYETDVLLLSDHGSDNVFSSDDFLDEIKPRAVIALCSLSHQQGSPDETIVSRLKNKGVLFYSTAAGDVIIETAGNHKTVYKIWNHNFFGDKVESVSQEKFTKKAVKWSEQFM